MPGGRKRCTNGCPGDEFIGAQWLVGSLLYLFAFLKHIFTLAKVVRSNGCTCWCNCSSMLIEYHRADSLQSYISCSSRPLSHLVFRAQHCRLADSLWRHKRVLWRLSLPAKVSTNMRQPQTFMVNFLCWVVHGCAGSYEIAIKCLPQWTAHEVVWFHLIKQRCWLFDVCVSLHVLLTTASRYRYRYRYR